MALNLVWRNHSHLRCNSPKFSSALGMWVHSKARLGKKGLVVKSDNGEHSSWHGWRVTHNVVAASLSLSLTQGSGQYACFSEILLVLTQESYVNSTRMNFALSGPLELLFQTVLSSPGLQYLCQVHPSLPLVVQKGVCQGVSGTQGGVGQGRAEASVLVLHDQKEKNHMGKRTADG